MKLFAYEKIRVQYAQIGEPRREKLSPEKKKEYEWAEHRTAVKLKKKKKIQKIDA